MIKNLHLIQLNLQFHRTTSKWTSAWADSHCVSSFNLGKTQHIFSKSLRAFDKVFLSLLSTALLLVVIYCLIIYSQNCSRICVLQSDVWSLYPPLRDTTKRELSFWKDKAQSKALKRSSIWFPYFLSGLDFICCYVNWCNSIRCKQVCLRFVNWTLIITKITRDSD